MYKINTKYQGRPGPSPGPGRTGPALFFVFILCILYILDVFWYMWTCFWYSVGIFLVYFLI